MSSSQFKNFSDQETLDNWSWIIIDHQWKSELSKVKLKQRSNAKSLTYSFLDYNQLKIKLTNEWEKWIEMSQKR